VKLFVRNAHYHIISPFSQTGFLVIQTHKQLWGSLLWERLDEMPLDQKMIILFVLMKTLAILTIIEILVFKK